MNAPRWTLSHRAICLDGKPLLVLVPASFGMLQSDLDAHTRRIVALLNTVELTPDAVAALQTAVMGTAAITGLSGLSGETRAHELVLHNTLNALTDTLNHTARVYVELTEEASIVLDGDPT